MRRLLILLAAATGMISCNNSGSGKNSDQDTTAGTAIQVTRDSLIGSFVGPFGDNKITLLITGFKGDTVQGRSIVGGNDRPFNGLVSLANGVYSFFTKEPGDDPDDGTFKFNIAAADISSLSGSWIPFDEKKPEKTYTLSRKNFVYDTAVGTYPASSRLLAVKDVENEMRGDLEYMRNEIFARHGYCFNKKETRQLFEMQDWYVPNTVDIRGYLTDIEKKNIALIKRYEKYAEDYGDEYGR